MTTAPQRRRGHKGTVRINVERMKELLGKSGLTQEELEGKSGVSVRTIRRALSKGLIGPRSKTEVEKVLGESLSPAAPPTAPVPESNSSPATELERQLALSMRDAIAKMRLPFQLFCQDVDPANHCPMHLVLQSAPPDLPSMPARPDPVRVASIVALCGRANLLRPIPKARVEAPDKVWAEWFIDGMSECARDCKAVYVQCGARSDVRQELVAGLLRLSRAIESYAPNIVHILNIPSTKGPDSVLHGHFKIVLLEMLHAERVWRLVVGGDVTA